MLRADDRALDSAETRRRARGKARWHGHFEHDIFPARNTFHGDKHASGADVQCGAEFKDGFSFLVCAVDKNGKCQRQSLPTSGLVLGGMHE